MVQLEKYRGKVTLGPVRKGTGSEHRGITLRTTTGERLVLVRLGGNPFDDSATRKLAGHTVEVEGYRIGRELRYVGVRLVD